MTKINKLKQDLKDKKIVILDGAMGTEITAKGIKTTLPLWSAECLITNPEAIKEIHIANIKAGAQIITTNTFRTTRRTFNKIDKGEQAKKYTILACKLAKEAILETDKKDVLIAGSVAPLEDCYSPELVPQTEHLEREHLEYITNLKTGGVDFIFLETMISIREIIAACKAAKKVGLSVAVSFCCRDNGDLLSGEKLEDAVLSAERFNPIFLSINCMSPESISRVIKKLSKLTKLPIGAYAQGDGEPDDNQGWRFSGKNNQEIYLKYAKEWVKDGVQIIGGCCGTNSENISRLTSMVAMMQTLQKEVSS